jgi:hypothetical protein
LGEEDHDHLAAEARARKESNKKLVEAGWLLWGRAEANLYSGQAAADRRGSLLDRRGKLSS